MFVLFLPFGFSAAVMLDENYTKYLVSEMDKAYYEAQGVATNYDPQTNCNWMSPFIGNNPFNSTMSFQGQDSYPGIETTEIQRVLLEFMDARHYNVPWLKPNFHPPMMIHSGEFYTNVPVDPKYNSVWKNPVPEGEFIVADTDYGSALCEPNKGTKTCCMGMDPFTGVNKGQMDAKVERANMKEYLVTDSASAWYPRCHSLIKQYYCDVCNANASMYNIVTPSLQRADQSYFAFPYVQTIFCESFVENLYKECRHVPAFQNYWVVPKEMGLLDFKRLNGIPVDEEGKAPDWYPNEPGVTCFNAVFNAGFLGFSVSRIAMLAFGIITAIVTFF